MAKKKQKHTKAHSPKISKEAPAQKHDVPSPADVEGAVIEASADAVPIREDTPPPAPEPEDVPAPESAQKVETTKGYMHTSSAVVGMILCLLCGTFLGTLLPQAMQKNTDLPSNTQEATAPQTPTPAPQQVPMPQQPPTPHENITQHMAQLEQLVTTQPDEVRHWISLGNLYFDTSEPQKAINAYEKALQLQPNNADVLTDLGVMYREVGNYQKALESFDKAVELNPQHQNSLFNGGVVLYFDLARKADGKKRWEQLLQVNPLARAPDGRPLKDMLRQLPN